MKRIALNGRFTGNLQPTGTQKVAFELFDKILRRNRDFEFVVFADSQFPGVREWEKLPGTIFVETPLTEWSKAHGQMWEQFQLPSLYRHFGCKVAHHPITTSPAFKKGVKSVVTLHDLNYYLHPEWYRTSFCMTYAFCATPGLRRADRLVAISNYVYNQARKALRFPEERLRMVYNGAIPLTPSASRAAPDAPYILCVGALPPQKNLVRMIKAFNLIRNEFPDLELHLVGRPHPRMNRKNPVLARLLESPGVKSLGYLSDTALANAYADAKVYCYPSLEEGFGLPILEAMLLGTPVVTSNVSCLPEIAGPDVVLVDPHSFEAIAAGLRQALNFSLLERQNRASLGKLWAGKFSWANTADHYLKIYEELF